MSGISDYFPDVFRSHWQASDADQKANPAASEGFRHQRLLEAALHCRERRFGYDLAPMPKPKRKNATFNPPFRSSISRKIVPIDQGPLRQDAVREARRKQADVARLRNVLVVFEKQDVPEYSRWLAQNFGALLSEIRTLEASTGEKMRWIEAIEEEICWGMCSPHDAYCRVKRRFEAPPVKEAGPKEEDDDFDDEFTAEEEAEFDEALTSRDSFEGMLREIFGVNPRTIPPNEYEQLYEEFKNNLADAGIGKHAEPSKRADAPRQAAPPPPLDPAKESLEQRCKALYRVLVRRLHPDVRADGDATVAAIWHEVQAAYEKRDLDRLQTLVAMADIATDGEQGALGLQSSLGELLAAVREFKRSIRALQASIRGAKSRPEWGFVSRPDRDTLLRRTLQTLQDRRTKLNQLLADATAQIEEWSHPPVRRQRQKGKAKKTAKKEKVSVARDQDLPF